MSAVVQVEHFLSKYNPESLARLQSRRESMAAAADGDCSNTEEAAEDRYYKRCVTALTN